MSQALESALLIKSPIFKQMLFPVCSCKFFSRVLTVFYQRAPSCSTPQGVTGGNTGVQSSTSLAAALQDALAECHSF